MKKFTTIATALMLGSLGFAAKAAVSSAVPTVMPASGTVMEVLPDDFTVTWDSEIVTLNPEGSTYQDWGFGMIFADVEAYVDGKAYEYVSAEVSEDGKSLNVMITWSDNFKNDFPGKHDVEFKFPEGLVLLGSAQEENAAFSVTYVVGSGEASYLPAPAITPEDGTVMTYAEAVNLNWEEDQIAIAPAEEECYAVVVYGDEAQGKMVEINFETMWVENENGEWEEGPAYVASIDWPSLTYNDDYTTKTGKYTIIIEEGMIANADDPSMVNEEIVLNYILKGSVGNEVINPKPEYGKMFPAEALSNVTVTWEGKSFISYDDSMAISVTKVNNNAGGPLMLAEAVTDGVLNPDLVKVDEETATICLDLSSLEEGEWNIEIPSGYASFDEYTVTSSVQINYTIFNGLASATVLQPEGDIVNSPVPVNLTWDYVNVVPTTAGLSATISYNDSDWNNISVEVPAENFKLASVTKPGEGDSHEPMPYAEEGGNVLSIDVVDLLEGVTGYVTIMIPEGIVADAEGLVNPKQEVQFQIIPAFDGEYKAEISDNVLTLTWDGATGAWPNASATPAFIENNDGVVFTFSVYDNVNATPDWNGLMFELAAVAELADGDYTLVVPGNFAYIETEDGQRVNNEIYISLNVKDGVVTIQQPVETLYLPMPEITPADESVIYGSPANVVLTWDEDIEAASGNLNVTLSYNGGEPITIEAELLNSGRFNEETGEDVPEAPYMLVIDWADYTYAENNTINAGDYVITVPSGLLKNEAGAVNAQYVLAYTVYAVQGEDVILPDPFAWNEDWTAPITYTSEELAEVKVVYKSDLTAVENAPAITVTDLSNGAESVLNPELVKVKDNCIVLDLSGFGDGEWYFYIPAGYAKLSETTYTNFAEFTYTIDNDSSGIDTIEAASNSVESVYNLNGVKMNNDINSLAPGLYIINGKKVLVRK